MITLSIVSALGCFASIWLVVRHIRFRAAKSLRATTREVEISPTDAKPFEDLPRLHATFIEAAPFGMKLTKIDGLVEVTSVDTGSAADKQGICTGAILEMVNGIMPITDLVNANTGEQEIVAESETFPLTATAAQPLMITFRQRALQLTDAPTKLLDLVVEGVESNLGVNFEVVDGHVCCSSITAGSLCATSGMLVKDRLIAINEQPVPRSANETVDMLKRFMPGTISIEVAREWRIERAMLVKNTEHHSEQLTAQTEAMRMLEAGLKELSDLEKSAVEATDYLEASRVKDRSEAAKAELQTLQHKVNQLTQEHDALKEAIAKGDRAEAIRAAEIVRANEAEMQRQKNAAVAALARLMVPADLLHLDRPALRLAINQALALSVDTTDAQVKLKAAEEAHEAAQARLDLLTTPTDMLQIDRAALRVAIEQMRSTGADVAHAQATLEKAEAAVVTAELAELTDTDVMLIDRDMLMAAIERARAAGVDVVEAQATLEKADRSVELASLTAPGNPLDIDCNALKKAIGRAQRAGVDVSAADAKLRLALKATELQAKQAEFEQLEKAQSITVTHSSASGNTKTSSPRANFSTSVSHGHQRALESMAQWEFSSISIIWGRLLGAGGSCAVYEVQYGDDSLAAKKLDIDRSSSRNQQEMALIREFRALHKVGAHPNIVALVGVVTDDPSCLCLLMELADRGSLCQVLQDTPQEIVGVASVQVSLAHDVAVGLAFCHGLQPQPLLHHDIKSANILLFSADETGAKRLTAKLADFGLAVGVRGESTAAAAMTKTKTNAGGGTFAYRSPESFGGEFTTASEVYSYGIVLFEILTGLKPWAYDASGKRYMDMHVMNLVKEGKRPEVPKGSKLSSVLHRSLLNLMRRCWDQRPKKRPAFEAIVKELKPRLPSQVLASFSEMEQKLIDLHNRINTVDLHVQLSSETTQQILQETILTAEARLIAEVRTGSAEILQQMRLLHGSLLPEIQCVVAQQTLELTAMKQVSGGGDGSGGMMGWLFGSAEEEAERLVEAQRSVKAAIDMADAKLRASVAAGADNGASAEIMKKLSEMHSAMEEASSGGRTAQSPGADVEAMLSKLDQMSSHLAQMDSRMMQMRLEVDDSAKEQARQLGLIHTKLDTLLTGSHEQVFRHFILVPKPYKGYMGRAIDKLQPRHWFAKPMLLIPLYQSPSGELKRAPMANEGFEVAKPHDFVKKHPRAVQLAMLVLQAGIKVGAAQLGVAIPAASLDMLSVVTGALVTDTLKLTIEAMAEDEASQKSVASSEKDRENSMTKYMAKEAAKVPPDEVLEKLSSSDEYKAASRNEYALLKEWLDRLHPGWQARCGLEPTVNQATGTVEWLPMTGGGASSTARPTSDARV